MRKIEHIRRRLFEAIVVASLGACLPTNAQPSTAARVPPSPLKPNIILILADDLGYGDLGCYGQKKIRTPNLDRMANQGIRFTSFYSGSTVCAPSRCALMTGLHSGHCLIRGNAKVPLRLEDLTVAKLMQDAGYRTGLIGKWGLGKENTTGVPQKQGFDIFFGYLDQTHAHDYYPSFLWRYDARTGFDDKQLFPENQEGKTTIYSHDLFTTAATNFVRVSKPEQQNGFRPFFLFLSYTIPHANNEETRRSGNGMQVPSDAPYSNEPWPQPEKNKAAMITRLDGDVGKLLDLLKAFNIDEGTVIFFSSDNGPHKEGGGDPNFFASSGPLRGIKRDLYEGGIRVPLIVRWPGRIKPRQVSEQVGAFWDLLPTMAEIAGVKPPPNIDGISLLPTLVGRTQTNQHDFLYWEFHERGFQQAARMGAWKAVRLEPGQPLELYNLENDIGEQKNIASEHPGVVAKFEAYLKTVRTESDLWPVKVKSDKGTTPPRDRGNPTKSQG